MEAMEKCLDITEFEILVLKKERKMWSIIHVWCKNRTSSANFHNFIRVTYIITYSRFFLSLSFFLIFSYYRENVASFDSCVRKHRTWAQLLYIVSRKVIFRSSCYQITLSDIAFFHFSTYIKFTLFVFEHRHAIYTTKLFYDAFSISEHYFLGEREMYTWNPCQFLSP